MGKRSLALTTNWWVTLRDREPVRCALAKAARRQWLPLLEQRLHEYKSDGSGPSSWERLAHLLDVNPGNLFLWRAGKTQERSPSLKLQDLISFASELHLSVCDLVPEPSCQVAWAVETLTRHAVTLPEAQAYGVYCHALPASHWTGESPWNGGLDRSAVRGVVEAGVYQREQDAEQAIWKVADHLEVVLEAAWQAAK